MSSNCVEVPLNRSVWNKNVLPIQCYARGNNDEHGILFLLNWGNANRFYKPLKYEQGARFYKPRWKGEIHKQNAKHRFHRYQCTLKDNVSQIAL